MHGLDLGLTSAPLIITGDLEISWKAPLSQASIIND
jgi:hypothetical protein